MVLKKWSLEALIRLQLAYHEFLACDDDDDDER
jgi:hypothetical protein